MKRLILKCTLSPGDVMTMTAAIKSLHDMYPGQYETDIRTSSDAIFEHNPYITKLDDSDAITIDMHYTDAIARSNQIPIAFLSGYTQHLGSQLQIPLSLTTNRPHLWLSQEETVWINQVKEHFTGKDTPFWVVNAGVKNDFTLKQWPVESYQEVVDRLRGRVQFVQVGASEHDHPPLQGVIDLRGKTDLRQLIRLCWWAKGGLGPITFLQHILAAFEKPYVALVGGREPASWVQYPCQVTLHTIGLLDCCRAGACWKSRVIALNDGSEQDLSLCEQPILGLSRPVGKCMAMIDSQAVADTISRYS